MEVPVAALVPVRSFASGKGRLGDVLTEEERRELGSSMADRIVGAAEGAGMIPAIITGDLEVSGWAAARGLAVVPESGTGLDHAAADGSEWATSNRLNWVVIHADLPLIQTEELSDLVDLIEGGKDVIAPSSDGGTSAIFARNDLAFAYGPGSFHHHLPRLRDPEIVVRVGLLHDLDSPNDLASALTHPRGEWMGSIVKDVAR